MAGFAVNHTLILSILLLIVCIIVSTINTKFRPKDIVLSPSRSGAMATEIHGVKIHKKPPSSKLVELGVTVWPKWGCGPSKFPWTFTATETMYLLEGRVKVYVDGHEQDPFEIGAGDLVVFPKGMKITWDVIESVSKHYSLEEN